MIDYTVSELRDKAATLASLAVVQGDLHVASDMLLKAALHIEQTGWRSIESAPRDGTYFIAITEGRRVFKTGWEMDEWGEHGGWAGPHTPEFWMPLPELPHGV